MAKGVLYIMATAVPGLIKIGKTGTSNFEQRMTFLEQNGYRNVTALKRTFAIEVDDYDEKEALLHTIFEKSRVSNTELFALDVDIATQLLASFDGNMVYPNPNNETIQQVFTEATDSSRSKLIPDGTYSFKKKKRSDNKTVCATAVISDGKWTLRKGSILGVFEDVGVSQKAKAVRVMLQLDSNGTLLEDADLGACTPSFAGTIVMNASNNGWTDWKNQAGQPVDIYRQNTEEGEQ